MDPAANKTHRLEPQLHWSTAHGIVTQLTDHIMENLLTTPLAGNNAGVAQRQDCFTSD